MTNLEKTFTLLLFALSTFAFSASASAGTDWAFCYNRDSNRVYFQTKTDIQQNKGRCRGKTYFQGEKHFTLVVDELNNQGFPKGLPGTAVDMKLKSGKRLLITQWNNLSKYDKILVLIPNHKNKTVKKACSLDNYSATFKARFNHKLKRFEVFVREPVSTYSEKFHKVWKHCKL